MYSIRAWRAYNFRVVPSQHPELDRICDKVEQLLTRHERLRRSHALLQTRLADLQGERALLQQRVDVACGRIDALLERLPTAEPATPLAPARSSMPR